MPEQNYFSKILRFTYVFILYNGRRWLWTFSVSKTLFCFHRGEYCLKVCVPLSSNLPPQLFISKHPMVLNCPLTTYLYAQRSVQPSALLRETPLYSGLRLIQRLTSHQRTETKWLWGAWTYVGRVCHPFMVQRKSEFVVGVTAVKVSTGLGTLDTLMNSLPLAVRM